MCRVVVILIAFITIALPCLGQSVFMDYGKNSYALVVAGNYSNYDTRGISNIGTFSLGTSISFGGRVDLIFEYGVTIADKGEINLKNGFGVGTEVFLYKRPKGFPMMFSIGFDIAGSEHLGAAVSPLIISIKGSRSANIFPVISAALSYYDVSLDLHRRNDHGTAISGQILLFARTSNKYALTFGPTFTKAEHFESFAFLFGLLFI